MSRRPGLGVPAILRLGQQLEPAGGWEIPRSVTIAGKKYPLDSHMRKQLATVTGNEVTAQEIARYNAHKNSPDLRRYSVERGGQAADWILKEEQKARDRAFGRI